MGNCDCILVWHLDENEFNKHSIRRARKEHKCEECGKAIHPDDQYEYWAAKSEGQFWTAKTCLDCKSIRDAFYCEGWIFGKVLEKLREYLQEVNGKVSDSCLLSLTPKARDRVCDMIQEVWDEED